MKEIIIVDKDFRKCPYCNYIWKPRKKKPVSCAKCKLYFKEEKVPEVD